MNKIVLLFLTGLLLAQCSIDRTINSLSQSEIKTLNEFENLEDKYQVQIADINEPGQRLLICLKIVSTENNRPLINEQINLYHTSSTGEYEPKNPNDESTARLKGSAYTDEMGRVFIKTILPGDYGSSQDNRHIHTSVNSANPAAYDIHFKQYTSIMGKNFANGSDQHFLADLKQTEDSTLVTFLTIKVKKYQNRETLTAKALPDCEWCGAKEAPINVSWETVIASEEVEGEPLILEGTIYENDGKTPAKNVIVYAYHTNHLGKYEKKGDETGNGVRHGYLRAWAKTNDEGRYRFTTIKPAPYPSHSEPAHIHMTLMREDFDEYWINSTWFKGDDFITQEMLDNLNRIGGFSNIIELKKNENKAWIGTRNIILNPTKN